MEWSGSKEKVSVHVVDHNQPQTKIMRRKRIMKTLLLFASLVVFLSASVAFAADAEIVPFFCKNPDSNDIQFTEPDGTCQSPWVPVTLSSVAGPAGESRAVLYYRDTEKWVIMVTGMDGTIWRTTLDTLSSTVDEWSPLPETTNHAPSSAGDLAEVQQ